MIRSCGRRSLPLLPFLPFPLPLFLVVFQLLFLVRRAAPQMAPRVVGLGLGLRPEQAGSGRLVCFVHSGESPVGEKQKRAACRDGVARSSPAQTERAERSAAQSLRPSALERATNRTNRVAKSRVGPADAKGRRASGRAGRSARLEVRPIQEEREAPSGWPEHNPPARHRDCRTPEALERNPLEPRAPCSRFRRPERHGAGLRVLAKRSGGLAVRPVAPVPTAGRARLCNRCLAPA